MAIQIKKIVSNVLIATIFLFILSCNSGNNAGESEQETGIATSADTLKRKAYLEEILNWLPAELLQNGHVSFLDTSIKDWVTRTGELPPDFDKMPSIPFLPNPLVLDEGGKNIPVTTPEQWQEKRKWMREKLEYYISGTFPPKPTNLKVKLLTETKNGQLTSRLVQLSFGPGNKAKLTVELLIPPGKGPFPVFMTQWTHRGWAKIAVRRGYIGCVYAGADDKDDTEEYSKIWAGKYDFSRLMRRAFGASRAVDYLYTLPFVDTNKIGLTGHSRNGKQSLWATAFDQRITAVIPSSGGAGAEIPWRYCAHKYDEEDIAYLGCARPSWLHPRLRFFIGRENKLPVDQNLFMALVAPRGLMISYSLNEVGSNPWGAEQAYNLTRKVYDFLGEKDNLAIRIRHGKHGTRAQDIEDYIDFFDFVFGRSNKKPDNKLYYTYTFENWCKKSGENINPKNYPAKGIDDLLIGSNGKTINSVSSWLDKKPEIKKNINWGLGNTPPGVINTKPRIFSAKGRNETEVFGSVLSRPGETTKMGRIAISPYNSFGDYLYGYLYYPKNKKAEMEKGKLPVMIYLHEFDYSKGFSSMWFDHTIQPFFENMVDRGFAVFAYDMIGCGNRNEEGTNFYERYPHWSKMGKSVADLKTAIDALMNYDVIDSSKIFVTGYSYGATVALYTAALDKRIAGVVSVAGFTPMRLATKEKGLEGIKAYSHLHAGLMPRLGFFVDNEAHIPYDFHEILACIAPRPLLIIAPEVDTDANIDDVKNCVNQAKKVFELYKAEDNIELWSPHDYNRFSDQMRQKTYNWASEKLNNRKY